MSSSSGIRAGRAFVELFADDSKLVRTLNATKGKLKSWAGSLASLGGSLAGIGAGILTPLLATTAVAGDMAETMSKFDAVFKDNAAAVGKWADDFSAAVGRSKKETAESLSAFQGFFLGLGVGSTEAAELSKSMSSLAVDFGSFNNVSDPESMQRFISALSGSGEVLAMYGINLKQAALDQKLLTMGFPESAKGATEMQKALARMEIIRESMGAQGAIGDAIKTAGGFANQMKALKAGLLDVAISVGQAVIPPLNILIGFLKQGANAVSAWVQANPGFVQGILAVGAGVAALGVGFVVLSGILSTLGTVVGVVATVFTAIGAAIAFILTPLGAVVAAVAGFGVYFAVATESGNAMVSDLTDGFQSLADQTLDAFGAIGDALMAGDIAAASNILWTGLKLLWVQGTNYLSAAWDAFTGYLGSALSGAQNWISQQLIKSWAGIQTIWLTVCNSLSEAWQWFCNSAADLWAGIQGTIEDGWNSFVGLFDDTVDAEALAAERVAKRNAEVNARKKEQTAEAQKKQKEMAEKLQKIGAEERGSLAALEQGKSNADKKKEAERAAKEAAAKADVDKALAEFEAAKNRGRQAKIDDDAKKKGAELSGLGIKGLAGAAAGAVEAGKIPKPAEIVAQAEKASGNTGSFSAAAAARVGAGGLPEKQLGEAKKHTKLLDRTVAAAEGLVRGLSFQG